MLSWPLVRYVLMAALRDRLIVSLGILVAVGAALSVFLGSGAFIESSQFALVFTAGGLRFAGAVGLVLFVVFYIRRSFENKDVEFLLSRPISRSSFILSHAVGFSLLAIILGCVIGVAVCAVVIQAVGPGHGLWVFSLIMEYILIVNAALFFAMVLQSAASGAMAVFGLYVLSRLMGQLLGIASVGNESPIAPLLNGIMNIVSMIVPRIDLMTQTTWLVYPDAQGEIGFAFIAIQGVIYTGLLICAALIDLRRRQF
jgi:hypothetical protein